MNIDRLRPLFVCLLFAGSVCPLFACSNGAATADEPERIGLFIGINDYPDPSVTPLDGCVADARAMEHLFSERFGFASKLLLTDEDATRRGIRRGFEWLLERVVPGRGDSVVVFYAGHGSRVPDTDESAGGLDEAHADRLDECWVPHDGTLDGKNIVLDDDIQVLIDTLLARGAQVVLISDSCHSGTIHRGGDSAKHREVRIDPDAYRPGRPLLGRAGEGMQGDESGARSGFVSFSAASANQKAYEYTDESGDHCGRFTYALRRIAGEIDELTTFEDLDRMIKGEFIARGWLDYQTPQFAASDAKRAERFLGGGVAPPHARVVEGSAARGSLEVNMGSFDGVREGTVFSFYRTISDMESGEDPIARGEAKSVEPFSSVVRLEEGASVEETAIASPDTFGLSDVVVRLSGLGGERDAPLRALVDQLERDGKILVDRGEGTPASIVIARGRGDAVGFYSPDAYPGGAARGAAGEDPVPLRAFSPEEADGAFVGDELMRIAQAQRLMSLSANEGMLAAEFITPGGEPVRARGVPAFADGDKFVLRVTNRSDEVLFITVLAENLDPNKPIHQIRMETGDESRIDPGESRDVDIRALIGNQAEEAIVRRDGFVRTPLKILAFNEPRSFTHLLMPPRAGVKGRSIPKPRGAPNDRVDAFFADLLHGGAVNARAAGAGWGRTHTFATASVAFDVYPERVDIPVVGAGGAP